MPERRAAYEAAYRDCAADSVRDLLAQGLSRDEVSVRIVSARRAALDSIESALPPRRGHTTVMSAYAGCSAALGGIPNVYDTAAVRRYRDERAARAASEFARAHPWWRLNTHKSVFYFVVLFSAIVFALAFRFRSRDESAVARRWWAGAGVVTGVFVGAFTFMAIGMIGALFMFFSEMTPRQLLAFSVMTIAFAAAGVAIAPRSHRRWRM